MSQPSIQKLSQERPSAHPMSRNSSLILASTSLSRKKILNNTGLDFAIAAPEIDERKLQEKMANANLLPEEIAKKLAKAKAKSVSIKHEKPFIIGADQVLVCEGKLLTKSSSAEEAKEKLRFLRGKEHTLISAVCVFRKGDCLWDHTDKAVLKMKNISDSMLDHYAKIAKQALMRSVGCYEIESHGALLFEEVKGDFFTILGLPLFPLLGFLENEMPLEKHLNKDLL